MWYLYILLCQNNSLYTGITKNVDQRFLDHQKGTGAKYTRSHTPIKIIHIEKLDTRSLATKRELEIKSWTRHKKIQALNLNLS